MPLVEGLTVLSLSDVGFSGDIPEPYFTFEENSLAKASALHAFTGKNVFADDSGICVNALNGAPGVNSAHYSGQRDDEKNLQKVLEELKGAEDRSAFYKAVICLVWNNETYYFEGICRGTITEDKIGEGGFGYDPIFIPEGFTETFAQLPLEVKNRISHRGQAVRKMAEFLREQAQKDQ